MVVAVFALAIAGGTWTHADANNHHHSASSHDVVADHFHADVGNDTFDGPIHCGSDNFLCSEHNAAGQKFASPVSTIATPRDWRLRLSEEPPPPRVNFS